MKRYRGLFCVFLACALLFSAGCFNLHFEEPDRPFGMTDPTAAFDPSASMVTGGVATAPTSAPATVPTAPAPTATAAPAPTTAPAATAAPGAKTPDAMTNAELLSYFNETLNKVKTQNVGFTKTKKTDVLDLQLSNSLANSVVDMVKGALLSSDSESQTVPKGASGVNIFSPTGKDYVSTLTEGDITSIACTKNGVNYVIKAAVKGETNPGEGSAMSHAFDYITVEDVMTTYAPKVGATVEQSGVSVVFSDCTAELTVDAAGSIQKYTTYVKGVMNLKDASIAVLKTDVAVTLASTTDYTNFAY